MGKELPVTVRLPGAWLCGVVLVGAGLGVGAAFAVGPVADWMIRLFDGVPGPLKLVASLPLVWSMPVLTLVGALAGAWVAGIWHAENPVVEVGPDSVVVRDGGGGRHVERAQVAEVFIDGHDLVLRGSDGREYVRTGVDSGLAGRLRSACERHGYPWCGTVDPHESAYTVWVDGTPDLDESTHALLRKRRRAIADDRTGAAEEAREELQARGISVRDRGKAQQYREV